MNIVASYQTFCCWEKWVDSKVESVRNSRIFQDTPRYVIVQSDFACVPTTDITTNGVMELGRKRF